MGNHTTLKKVRPPEKSDTGSRRDCQEQELASKRKQNPVLRAAETRDCNMFSSDYQRACEGPHDTGPHISCDRIALLHGQWPSLQRICTSRVCPFAAVREKPQRRVDVVAFAKRCPRPSFDLTGDTDEITESCQASMPAPLLTPTILNSSSKTK